MAHVYELSEILNFSLLYSIMAEITNEVMPRNYFY